MDASDELVARMLARGINDDDVNVRITVERDLESNLFVVDASIRLWVHDEDRDDDETDFVAIGEIAGWSMPYVADLEDLIAAADDVDEVAYDLVSLPWRDDELVLDVFSSDGLPFTGWLGIDVIKIDERFRGRQLSYVAMEEFLRFFAAAPCVLVTMRPSPATEPGTLTGDDSERSDADAAGRRRLQQHWTRFGFRSIDGRIFGHDSGLVWPEGSWMSSR